jgi:hypothetical protein
MPYQAAALSNHGQLRPHLARAQQDGHRPRRLGTWGGPRNVLSRRGDSTEVACPFRGLRKLKDATNPDPWSPHESLQAQVGARQRYAQSFAARHCGKPTTPWPGN